MWEHAPNPWAEQPSIQDLITTSIMGAALGELFHRWSVAILRKGHLNFGQKALVFFLNPSYVIKMATGLPGERGRQNENSVPTERSAWSVPQPVSPTAHSEN